MTRHMGRLPGMSVALAALMVGVPASPSGAGEFTVANVIAELNNTDEDLGFHALIDGDAWKLVEMTDPNGRKILQVRPTRSLRRQGMTELFFESAEPNFEDLSPEAFFERFPAGKYRITGRTIDGKKLKSTAVFTHVMPAPPVIYVNKEPLPEDCDAGPVPEATNPNAITITWDEVTTSHPDVGVFDPDIEIDRYEVVVEREPDEGEPLKFTVELPPTVTTLKLPKGLANPGERFKIEVLAREVSGNQTATETCFDVAKAR